MLYKLLRFKHTEYFKHTEPLSLWWMGVQLTDFHARRWSLRPVAEQKNVFQLFFNKIFPQP